MGDPGLSEDQIIDFENLALDSGVIIFGHLLLVDGHLDHGLFPYRVEEVEISSELSLVVLLIILLSSERGEPDAKRNDSFCAKGQPEGCFSHGSL